MHSRVALEGLRSPQAQGENRGLDLVIDPAEKLQIAIWEVARQSPVL